MPCSAQAPGSRATFSPVCSLAECLRFAELARRRATGRQSLRHSGAGGATGDASVRAAQQIDVILLPLLAFDRSGAQGLAWAAATMTGLVRFGAEPGPIAAIAREALQTDAWAQHDAACGEAQCRVVERPLLVGIGYHWQEHPGLPVQPWDVPLDLIATDHELIRVRQPAN
jgi:5-formyltetrahydrofolate cyclo-ligase